MNKNTDIADRIPTHHQSESFSDIDFVKLKKIFIKNWVWLVAILIITNLIAYLLIRWTKPLYESESHLKLEFKSKATALGISNLTENKNINHLSGEIELLKSKLFFNKVIDAANIDVTYSFRGNILNDERYKFTAFIVEFSTISDPSLYDLEIDIDFIGEGKFTLSYALNDKQHVSTHEFNSQFRLLGTKLTIYPTSYYYDNLEKGHFFIINSRESLVNYLENNFDVQPLNFQANTIRVSLKDNNRHKAKELINIADSVYLEYSQQQKSIENNQKIEWLDKELSQVREKLDSYEDYFEKFTLNNRTNNLDIVLTETISTINQLDSQQYEIQKRLTSTSQLHTLLSKTYHSTITVQVAHFPADMLLMIKDYNKLVIDNHRVMKSYSTSTHTYKNSLNKLDQAKELLKSSNVTRKVYLDERLEEVIRRKQLLESRFSTIPSQDRQYKKSRLYYSLYEEQYLSLMQAKTNFEVAKAGTKTDITILSAASLPLQAISPNILVIQGIGTVTGLAICLVLLAIMYLISNSISNLSELERITKLPILGSIPKYTATAMANTRMVIQDSPHSAISESFRSIRTNIEFLSNTKSSKVISVTSTVSSEGKTFVSVNLGAVMALSKRKVVIVDLDMRKPSVHKAFGSEDNSVGVSTILIDKNHVKDVINDTTIDNLKYIAAGPTPPNPSELLLNGNFDRLIASLKSEFDVVILDTPPSAIVTDATLIMKRVDVPIYVFKADFSKKSFVNNLNRLCRINNFNNISVLLNNIQHHGNRKYGYGYYTDKGI